MVADSSSVPTAASARRLHLIGIQTALNLGLCICLAVAVAFRFIGLNHILGINGDEAYLATKSWMSLHGQAISLKTGSDLLPDPISLVLSWMIHLVGGISLWSLRLPVAITGVATIVAIFALSRRLWGPQVALYAAALGAVLPTHIVYSRFFWEPSQSPLVCMLWIYAAYARSSILFAVFGLLAVVVHPTNIFLAPLVLALFVSGFRVSWTDLRASMTSGRRLFAAIFGVTLALAALAYVISLRRQDFMAAWHRAGDLDEWMRFVRLVPGLFGGSTVYEYVIAPLPESIKTFYRLAYVLLFIIPLTISLTLDRKRLGLEVVAFAGSLFLFYLFAGAHAVSPNAERYGLWMTVPTCLFTARAWDHIAGERRPWLATLVVLCVCGALLSDFNARYFGQFESGNSHTENAFKSGRIEPKLQALTWIEQHRDPKRITRVFAEDWWTYWAMKYLSLDQRPAWQVTIFGSGWDGRFPKDFTLPNAPPAEVQAFYVGYTDGRLIKRMVREHPGASEDLVTGYGNLPILSVLAAR